MYTEFYGLREKPFSLSPDPRFLFLSDSHREALAHLLYGIEQGEGFIAITGEVGTGKTTLCRTLLQRLEPGSEVAFLFNPQLSGLELLQAIDAEFGLDTRDKSLRELMDQLNRFLLTKKQEGRRVLLLIDEAQNLDREALEQVRLLSNLETDTAKLIQIVLLGQPELDSLLESPDLRQLRQRISVRWRLRALSASETRDYVRHRLRVAAGGGRDLFTDIALREVHRRSGGVPRLINRLCDRALLAGYGEGVSEVGLGMVTAVQREIDRGAGPGGGSRSAGALPRRFQLAAGIGALAAIALGASVVWWRGGFEAGLAQPEPAAAAQAAAAPTLAPAPPVEAERPPEPAPPPADLGVTLALSSPAASVAASLDALLRSWGSAPLHAGLLPLAQLTELLENTGFSVLPLDEASVELLRAIDRPALIVLQPIDGAPRALLLRRLDADGVTLEGIGAEPLRVPAADLERFWTGKAFVPWRDHAALPPLLGLGDSGPSVRWLQESLAALGFFSGELSGEYGVLTEEAVREFQAAEALPADGWVGPITKIRLYERLPGYASPPHLASAAPAEPEAPLGGTS